MVGEDVKCFVGVGVFVGGGGGACLLLGFVCFVFNAF